ncbi:MULTISPECIES: DNA-binding protein [unclassified Pseudomonas]|uniref:DNA-binding protein n=1 Tax=unclassified Pseudomonas TaxID=196821 RepID=UPI000A1EFE3F|nr:MULTISPECIES: DNA-binding protein [unclassified Pseudomonas]
MARAGINKALVQRARDTLLARGEHPSIEAVRVELGNTGSKSTILRYLQELQASEPHPPSIRLDDELQTFIGSLAQRLAADAQAAVAEDRARLQRQQAAYEQQRAIDQARMEQLQTVHQELGVERQAAQRREQELNERLQTVDGECARLKAGAQHAQQLLEERTQQIRSLEEKHKQAHEALSHYRQQHLLQREQELQRHERQTQLLHQEARHSRELLMRKQEEVAQIYLELERINAEQQMRVQDLRRQEHELQQALIDNARLMNALQTAEAGRQILQDEIQALRARAHRTLLERRGDKQALRRMTLQLAQLHELLARLTTV